MQINFERREEKQGCRRWAQMNAAHQGSLSGFDWITTAAPDECRVNLILRRPRLGAKGAAMKIIGCDFHPSFQQIAMVDTETGEQTEKKLTPAEAVQFYSQLQGPVLVGMEAC